MVTVNIARYVDIGAVEKTLLISRAMQIVKPYWTKRLTKIRIGVCNGT